MTEKKTPERMCIACRKRAPKAALLRVVRDKAGTIAIDDTKKAEGRGAYLCADMACVALAEKKGCLSYAFRTQVSREIYQMLRAALEEGVHNDG